MQPTNSMLCEWIYIMVAIKSVCVWLESKTKKKKKHW